MQKKYEIEIPHQVIHALGLMDREVVHSIKKNWPYTISNTTGYPSVRPGNYPIYLSGILWICCEREKYLFITTKRNMKKTRELSRNYYKCQLLYRMKWIQ